MSRVYKTRQDEVWNVINDRDPSIQKSTVLTLDTLSFSHFLTCTHTYSLISHSPLLSRILTFSAYLTIAKTVPG